MRRIGDEALLPLDRCAQPLQQVVDLDHQRQHLGWQSLVVEGGPAVALRAR